MILNIRHIGFQVTNLDRAIQIYTKLDFTLKSVKEEQWYGKKLKVAKFFEGLELVETSFDWPVHGAFSVDRFPEELDNIEAEIRDGYEVKFAHDGEGNRLEFVRKVSDKKLR